MKVCLDVSPVVHHRAGIGRYTQELLSALTSIDAENEYIAFYNRPSKAQIEPPLERLSRRTVNLGDKPWRMWVMLAYFAQRPQDHLVSGIDLFHATDHLLPRLVNAKSVFTLYDLTFHFYAKTHQRLNRWYLALMTPRFLRTADAVTAISESTRRDAARVYGIDENKIQLVYPGVNARFCPASAEQIEAIRRKYALPPHFILAVSTLEPRKNLTTLLESIALLRPPLDVPLVIVGRKGWLYQGILHKLRELELEHRVLLTGYVPDDDLPGLYSAADLFVYPSLYEGFGLPVLEAMACGAPVITSNVSSMPEIVGDTQVTLDPHDVTRLAQAMAWVMTDKQQNQSMRYRGLEQARQFTWEKAAQEMLQVYRQAFGGARVHRP